MFAPTKLSSTENHTLIPKSAAPTEGQIEFRENLFTDKESRDIFAGLDAAKAGVLDNEVVVRGGNRYVMPRRTAFFAKRAASTYGYAGISKRPSRKLGEGTMGKLLAKVVEQIEARTGHACSGVLVNYYPDGAAGLGFHSDNEKDLDPKAPIVSVSFGATRDMVFKRKRKDPKFKDIKIALPAGSVVLMHPPLQSHWTHAIPKRANALARFNLTCRLLAATDEAKAKAKAKAKV